jgi:hypothetical protein
MPLVALGSQRAMLPRGNARRGALCYFDEIRRQPETSYVSYTGYDSCFVV